MTERPPFLFHSTVLFVSDVEASKRFYTGVMGEEIDLDLGANVGFKSALSIWDGAYAGPVIFGETGDTTRSGDIHQPFSSKRMLELYYETDDMDATMARLHAAGVEFVHKVTEQPWRQLTVRFLDPDGHMIEVGERMDVCLRRLAASGMTEEEIAGATTMPMEAVQFLLAGGDQSTDQA